MIKSGSDSQLEEYDAASIASILGVKEKDFKDFGQVKRAFRQKMIKLNHNSKGRTVLSNAYLHAIELIHGTETNQLVQMINDKYIKGLERIFKKDKTLLDKLIYDYPPIYYAVRAGHYSVVEYLLKKGCSIHFQGHKSTPMHAAAFFGQYSLIPLLLQYGIPTDISNAFDNKPVEEAATDEIRELLQNASRNKIHLLQQKLLGHKIILTTINIKHPQKSHIIMKKILLSKYKNSYPSNKFVDAFHGTSFQALESIARNGLKRPGDKINGKQVKTVDGHISMGTSLQGFKDWSKAIFVSPSIYYAAHPAYAKEVITNKSETWLPVVQVKVEINSFTKHDHTLVFYKQKDSEPTHVEYRVADDLPNNSEHKMIYRGQHSDKVHVVCIILLRKGFLDQFSNYKETTELILNSPQEKKIICQQFI